MSLNKEDLTQLYFRHLAQLADESPAIAFSHGKGSLLYDIDGKEYIDFVSGISVSSFGHNNPKIINAAKTQLDKHLHIMVFGEQILSPQVLLAKKISDCLPVSLSNVYFTNSGTEAIEAAMKLAKRFTGKTKIIATKNAYHGSTQGALSIMGNEFFKQAFRPLLPDIEFIEFNNLIDIEKIDDKTACVILEPIQSESGYNPASLEFLKSLRKKCDETSTLLIFDEVQSGMGRTAKLFAFEHYNVIPDVLVLAKALGAGFPLGAFISSKEIMSSLSFDPPLGHITTFGGHPLSCAASLAAFEILDETNFLTNVQYKSDLIVKILKSRIADISISGKGLMLAIHFERAEICQKIIKSCQNKGLLTDWFLFSDSSLRMAPPLTITEDEIIKSCEIIVSSINEWNQ